jgi:hypothetical protein
MRACFPLGLLEDQKGFCYIACGIECPIAPPPSLLSSGSWGRLPSPLKRVFSARTRANAGLRLAFPPLIATLPVW